MRRYVRPTRPPPPAPALGRDRAARPGRAGRSGRARLLGGLVEAVENGTTTAHVDKIDRCCWPASWSLQTVLTRYARYVSQVLGEQVLAELREDFVDNALALPVGRGRVGRLG